MSNLKYKLPTFINLNLTPQTFSSRGQTNSIGLNQNRILSLKKRIYQISSTFKMNSIQMVQLFYELYGHKVNVLTKQNKGSFKKWRISH